MTQERKRSKTPVSSFGPELLAALVKGASTEVELVCPTSAVATKLVQRLYTLRKRMREENHPQAALVQRAKVSNQVGFSLKGSKHNATVRISPHDSEYRDILRSAGIAVDAVKDTLLTDLMEEEKETRSDGAIADPIITPSDTSAALSPGFLSNLLKEYK